MDINIVQDRFGQRWLTPAHTKDKFLFKHCVGEDKIPIRQEKQLTAMLVLHGVYAITYIDLQKKMTKTFAKL